MPERKVEVTRPQVTVKTALIVCLTAVGVAAGVYLVVAAQVVLSLMIFSALIAAALSRLADWMIKRKVPGRLANGVVIFAMLVAVGGTLTLLVPPTIEQGRELWQQAPSALEKVRLTRTYQDWNGRLGLDRKVEQLKKSAPEQLTDTEGPVLKVLGGVAALVTAGITVFFFVVFMLLYGGALVNRLLEEALPNRRVRYQRLLSRVHRSIGGYVTGLSVLCLVNAVVTTLFLLVMGVPYALTLGIFSGIFSLLPLVGSVLSGVVITAVAFGAGGPAVGVVTGIYNIVYQEAESRIFAPLVYRRSIAVNPLVTMASLLIMAEVFGVLGAVLAVPFAAAAQVLIHELLILRRERLNLPLVGPAGLPEDLHHGLEVKQVAAGQESQQPH